MFGSARSLLGHEDEIADILARLRAGVRIEQLDAVRRHKDGHDIDVSLTISTIQDRSGADVGASTIARDVTEKKALTGRLAASEELLRTTIEHAPIGIALTSLDGRWLRVNGALCEMTGYSESDLLALDGRTLTHPEDRETSVGQVERLLAGEIDRIDMEERYPPI
jgi:PAS domain-containing protein